MVFANGRIVTRGQVLEDHCLVVEGQRISCILPRSGISGTAGEVVDLGGRYLSPGFIDIHLHGLHEFCVWTPDGVDRIARIQPRYGTTGFLPGIGLVPAGHYPAWMEGTRRLMEQDGDGALVLGGHMEGPYINGDNLGGFVKEFVWLPDPAEYKPLLEKYADVLKLMTLAPEVPGGMDLVCALSRHGIPASIGHSLATLSQVREAVAHGLKHACHLFDNVTIPNLSTDGCLRKPCMDESALLLDELSAEVITDGVHVHPDYLKLVRKCKPADKVVLVTDSQQGAGLEEGVFLLPDGRQYRVRKGDVARLVGSTQIVGSSLTMDRAVANYMRFTGAGIAEAVRAASANPAAVLGMDRQMGSLEPGKLANLTVFDDAINVFRTYVRGRLVYQREGT